MNALWYVYESGRWGWEQSYGYVVASADRLDWSNGGAGLTCDLVLRFERVPRLDVLQQAAAAFQEWFDGAYRPSRWERGASKHPTKKNQWWL